MIDELEKTSMIREYCECTEELKGFYNRMIEKYANFVQLHGILIRNNLKPFLNRMNATGGFPEGPLNEIIEKHTKIRSQKL